MKDFLLKMKKKTKSKHFVCFIFKRSKTLKVKIQYNAKIFEKLAEINYETVKKKQKATAQLHLRLCEKSQHMQHHEAFVFARLLSV